MLMTDRILHTWLYFLSRTAEHSAVAPTRRGGHSLEALGDGAAVGDAVAPHVLLLVVGEVRELDLGVVELCGQRPAALPTGNCLHTHDLCHREKNGQCY